MREPTTILVSLRAVDRATPGLRRLSRQLRWLRWRRWWARHGRTIVIVAAVVFVALMEAFGWRWPQL